MAVKPAPRRLQIVHPDCAGIDIGKAKHFVAVDPRHGDDFIRSFDAFTQDLEAMAHWLGALGVTIVAMEATAADGRPFLIMYQVQPGHDLTQ